MNSRTLELETAREIAGMLDEGIAVKYIANQTGLSWWTVNNIKAGKMMNPKSVEAIEEFIKNKSYHLTKHKIVNIFNTSPSASNFLLECDGFDWRDIKRIKEKV